MSEQVTGIAPNPAMDDAILNSHQEMLDRIGDQLIELQNAAYYRGYEVANTQAAELTKQRDVLVAACNEVMHYLENPSVEYATRMEPMVRAALARVEEPAP